MEGHSSFSDEDSDNLNSSSVTVVTDNMTGHQNISPPANPLLVGIVLDNIFQHLSSNLSVLKACRTVCSTWHEAATKHFRKISICIPMKYTSPGYIPKLPLGGGLFCVRNNNPTARLGEPVPDSIYKGFFHQSLPAILPYENIYITENIKGSKENRVSSADAVVTKWFRDWGPHMKGIRLKLKTFHNKNKTSRFLGSVLTQGCVNIEELELLGILNISFQDFHLEQGQLSKVKKLVLRDRHNSVLEEPYKTTVLSQIKTIFSAAPNVESIVLDIEDHDWAQELAKLTTESFEKLNTLQWCRTLQEKQVRELEKFPKAVQLKNIDLNCKIVPHSGNLLALKRFFAKFTNSLEMLRVTGDVTRGTDPDDSDDSDSDSDIDLFDDEPAIDFNFFEQGFPDLKKLKILEMGNVTDGRLNRFSVLQKFPNLQKIILKKPKSSGGFNLLDRDDGYNFHYFQNYENGIQEPNNSLREFRLESDIRMRDFVSSIAYAFPNLKVLHICVRSERIFAEVFRTMRSLEELSIKFRTNDFPRCNAALSGSLRYMRDLKRLTLEHLGPYPFQLRESTVVSGLKNSENLRWLHLVNFAVCQIERESILDHLKHYVTLKFTNCVIQSPPLNAVYGILTTADSSKQGLDIGISSVSYNNAPNSPPSSPSSSSWSWSS